MSQATTSAAPIALARCPCARFVVRGRGGLPPPRPDFGGMGAGPHLTQTSRSLCVLPSRSWRQNPSHHAAPTPADAAFDAKFAKSLTQSSQRPLPPRISKWGHAPYAWGRGGLSPPESEPSHLKSLKDSKTSGDGSRSPLPASELKNRTRRRSYRVPASRATLAPLLSPPRPPRLLPESNSIIRLFDDSIISSLSPLRGNGRK